MAVAFLIILYFGWMIKIRLGAMKKWAVLSISLVIVLATVFQFFIPNYSQYYYLGEGIMSFFCQNLEDESYQEAFDVICEYIEKKYPYFRYKNIIWAKMKNEAQAKIKTMALDIFSFVPSFDKALEKLWNTKALIIDIRNNTGGAIVLTDQILGRLTEFKVNYGGMLNTEGKFTPLYVIPRRPIYKRPVVILINELNGSAADYFSYAASQLNRVTLVGRPTVGVVSNPSKLIKLPGGAVVQLVGSGLADTFRNYVVEDVGVHPDVCVPYTILEIQSGIDRDLLTAKDKNFLFAIAPIPRHFPLFSSAEILK